MGRRAQEDLVTLDVALLALRRIVDAPSRTSTLAHGDRRVEMSTMLVVDQIARSEEGGCSVGEVADGLQVAHSTASRLVDRAVKAGMVVRTRQPEDPRRSHVTLTDAGDRLQEAASAFRVRRLAGIVADWPADEVALLAALLERFARDARDARLVPDDVGMGHSQSPPPRGGTR